MMHCKDAFLGGLNGVDLATLATLALALVLALRAWGSGARAAIDSLLFFTEGRRLSLR